MANGRKRAALAALLAGFGLVGAGWHPASAAAWPRPAVTRQATPATRSGTQFGPGAGCPSGAPGFTASFWNPYDDWSAAPTLADLQAARAVGTTSLVIDYAVDQEAGAAWYPDRVGYRYFEPTLPTVLGAARAAGIRVWMGLVVSPHQFAASSTNWAFLQAEVPRFEAVADDLYRQYGASVAGWYIPTEPTQTDVASYDRARQYGSWLGQIDSYLHAHDGDRPVMIAAQMPSAVLSGVTPEQYVGELAPVMASARIDVWDIEDGFGMTGWTPQQEAAGFSLAQRYAALDRTQVWADVYTPAASTPAQWEPYLRAIAATGTTQLSEWTFAEYMNPAGTTTNPAAATDYQAYRTYCL